MTKTISASQEHDSPGSPNPYDRHNANVSVKRQSLPEHEKKGTDLLVVKPLSIGYKRQNERRKSSRFSTAHQRVYIVVNLRKNSYHKVEIGKSPSCGCADSVKNSGKELCKHIIWTVLAICRLPGNSNLLHQLFLTDNEALSVVGNSYSVIPQNLMYKKATNKTRK